MAGVSAKTDESLSDRIILRITDLYPNSDHVKTLGPIDTDDAIIWEYAKTNYFAIVSKDSDFYQRSLLYGHPPKFIYLLTRTQVNYVWDFLAVSLVK